MAMRSRAGGASVQKNVLKARAAFAGDRAASAILKTKRRRAAGSSLPPWLVAAMKGRGWWSLQVSSSLPWLIRSEEGRVGEEGWWTV